MCQTLGIFTSIRLQQTRIFRQAGLLQSASVKASLQPVFGLKSPTHCASRSPRAARRAAPRGVARHRQESKQMGFHYSALTARGAAHRRVRNERHAFILKAARRDGSHKSPCQPITGDISNLIMRNLFTNVNGVLHNVRYPVYSILVSSCQGL